MQLFQAKEKLESFFYCLIILHKSAFLPAAFITLQIFHSSSP